MFYTILTILQILQRPSSSVAHFLAKTTKNNEVAEFIRKYGPEFQHSVQVIVRKNKRELSEKTMRTKIGQAKYSKSSPRFTPKLSNVIKTKQIK